MHDEYSTPKTPTALLRLSSIIKFWNIEQVADLHKHLAPVQYTKHAKKARFRNLLQQTAKKASRQQRPNFKVIIRPGTHIRFRPPNAPADDWSDEANHEAVVTRVNSHEEAQTTSVPFEASGVFSLANALDGYTHAHAHTHM